MKDKNLKSKKPKQAMMEEAWTQEQNFEARFHFNPIPQSIKYKKGSIPFPKTFSIDGLNPQNKADKTCIKLLNETIKSCGKTKITYTKQNGFPIRFKKSSKIKNNESYELESNSEGIELSFKSEKGRFNGLQTIRQLLAFSFHSINHLSNIQQTMLQDPDIRHVIPILSIKDQAHYEIRSFMIDPGRSAFSVPYIKQIIRIMASLKMNMLHIGLYNDQMCSFKFKTLKAGSENPYALSPKDLKEIIAYAKDHFIDVMPELQAWGHVQSIIYHYPETYGCPGMWGGSSFGIGKATFDLVEKIYDEIIPLLEDNSHIHLGMDEAVWKLLPGEDAKNLSPSTLVTIIYKMVQRLGRKHKKKLKVHLWADHGGRPLEKEIREKVFIEPWKYRQTDEEDIIKAVKKYGGKGKTPLMMGAGTSSAHMKGSLEATRIWCQAGQKHTNIKGATLCLWETNDLADRMITLYGGAFYLWNPKSPTPPPADIIGENLRNQLERAMRTWQILFPDASPEELNKNRGPEIEGGRFVQSIEDNPYVTPTADFIHAEKVIGIRK